MVWNVRWKEDGLWVNVAVKVDKSETDDDEPHVSKHFVYVVFKFLHVRLRLFTGFVAVLELFFCRLFFVGELERDCFLNSVPNDYEAKADNTVEQLGNHERKSVAHILFLVMDINILGQKYHKKYDRQNYESNVQNPLCFLWVK